MNYAILLAGGTGTRISSDIPKQYVRAGSHMMITVALKTLLKCDRIDGLCIVSDTSRRDEIENDIRSCGMDIAKLISYAGPGSNRQTSAFNGMKELIDKKGMPGEDDTVLIHDAARPLLSKELLNNIYTALEGHDGVMPVLPMKDTVYLSEDGNRVSGLLDRSKVYAGQAPELFLFKMYYDANVSLMPDKILGVNGASEPAIMAGMDIAMIPGDEGNFKVTTDADMDRYLAIVGGTDNGKGVGSP